MGVKISLDRFVTVLFLLLGISFLFTTIALYSEASGYLRAFTVITLFLYYMVRNRKKNVYFTMFLIFFTIAETTFFYYLKHTTLAYFIGNVSYCLAYGSLLVYVLRKMNLMKVVKRFSLHLIILVLFAGYVYLSIDAMAREDFETSTSEYKVISYLLFSIYNILLVLVLISSFLNYLYHDTKKALILFLACLCIVFSELVQIAAFIDSEVVLNIIYSTLLTFGFFFVYFYMVNKDKIKSIAGVVNSPQDL